MAKKTPVHRQGKKRWVAEIKYRNAKGSEKVEFKFEEFDELAQYLEGGPNFYTIKKITIRINDHVQPGLTVTQAMLQ